MLTVARSVKEHGLRIRPVRKCKATSASRHTCPAHKSVLDQRFVAELPVQMHTADVTCIPTDDGRIDLERKED